MLTKEYNMMGVGYYQQPGSRYVHYWTDSFGSWRKSPDQPCIGGSPAPTPAPGCADIDTMNCGYYKSAGYCSYSPNVQQQCRETCNIDGCGSAAPSPASSSSCQDTDANCAYYKSLDYCRSSENVKTHCRKTCGLCGGSAPSSSTCVDTDGACAYYRQNGYCRTSDNVKTHCKKTCGLCR